MGNLKKLLTRNPDNPKTGWTLIDFGNAAGYVHDGTNCFSFPMTDSNLYTRCLPSYATFVGSGSFGPIGGQPYNAFQWSSSGVNETLVVTQSSCMPLLMSNDYNDVHNTGVYVNLDSNVTAADFNVDISNCPPKSA